MPKLKRNQCYKIAYPRICSSRLRRRIIIIIIIIISRIIRSNNSRIIRSRSNPLLKTAAETPHEHSRGRIGRRTLISAAHVSFLLTSSRILAAPYYKHILALAREMLIYLLLIIFVANIFNINVLQIQMSASRGTRGIKNGMSQ